MIIAFKGRSRLVWLVSAAALGACGGEESNSGGKSDPPECVDNPNLPQCFGTPGWGAGGVGGPGAGGGFTGSTGGFRAGTGGGPPPPAGCGNGALDAGEECDGSQLNGATCAVATMGALPQGALACASDCRLVLTGCRSENGGGGGTGGGGPGTGARPGSGGAN